MTTVHVSNISHQTTEKEVRDFFSFCGKISSLSLTPSSQEPEAPQSATVTFEKETAGKTALLLDNTQLGSSHVHVEASSTLSDLAPTSKDDPNADPHHIPQEDKPRAAILAEYLAHGYVIGDVALQRGIELDKKHGITQRFQTALASIDSLDKKYKATDKARGIDSSLGVTTKAQTGWGTLNRYFEKALNTPTGQKVRDFYAQGAQQAMDIHNEARRLAELKKGEKSPTAGGQGSSEEGVTHEEEPSHPQGEFGGAAAGGDAQAAYGSSAYPPEKSA
jgi:hypothetical protein